MPSYGDGTRYGSGARYGSAPNPRNKMSKFKRELKDDTIPNKTTEGQKIIDASAGNASIGDVTVELAAFTAKNGALAQNASDLATAQAEVTRLVTQQDNIEPEWNADYEAYLLKIESNTKGSKVLMATLPVPTYEPGATTPAAAPSKVANLSATIGDMPRELDLAWNANLPKPLLYLLRMCEGAYNPAAMVQIGMPSASKFTAPNLLAGHTYWFEVCAVGTGNQQGPWSDPATGMAV